MSAISKSILRPASIAYRAYYPNVVRQTLAPFSITSRYLAEPTSTGTAQQEPEGKSFDTIPVHLGPIGKVVMVLGGLHSRLSDVPDSIPNRVYQRTKDRFRARCVVLSMFFTAGLSYLAATRGKSAHKEGKRYTDSVYDMHRGESRLHEQLEAKRQSGSSRSERYSPLGEEFNK